MFKEVLNDIKKKDGKKVNLNILIQPSMKEEFDKLCKENGTTMTAMMLGFIEKSLKDNPDYTKLTIQELEMEEIILEHKYDDYSNQLLNLPEFDDMEQAVLAQASIHNSMNFITNQSDNIHKEIYSNKRTKEREKLKNDRVAKLQDKDKK